MKKVPEGSNQHIYSKVDHHVISKANLLSEEESEFIRLFGKGFKIIKAFAMTCIENMIKYCTFFWAFYLLPS